MRNAIVDSNTGRQGNGIVVLRGDQGGRAELVESRIANNDLLEVRKTFISQQFLLSNTRTF